MTELEHQIAKLLGNDDAGYPRADAATIQAIARLCAPSLDEAALRSKIAEAIRSVGPVRPSRPSYMWSQTEKYAEAAATAAITAIREGRE